MNVLIFILLALVICLSPLIVSYGILKKANEKPWQGLIPIYNFYVLLKLFNRPRWYIIFLILPVISTILMAYISFDIYNHFGKKKFFIHVIGFIFAIFILPFVAFYKKFQFQRSEISEIKLKQELKNWGYASIIALSLVFFIKLVNILFFQNFKMPTGSMENSLLIGDHFYVNKLSVGPRLPITPLAYPFAQNTIPILGVRSFISSVQLPYLRLTRNLDINNNEIIVFNFPLGDTVIVQNPNQSYEHIINSIKNQMIENARANADSIQSDVYYKAIARDYVLSNYDISIRPIDRRDTYIKRCVGLPGDSLMIKNGIMYINNVNNDSILNYTLQHLYAITSSNTVNLYNLEKLGIDPENIHSSSSNEFTCALSDYQYMELKKINIFTSIEKVVKPVGLKCDAIFPYQNTFSWNEDNFGPLIIPKKSMKVSLTISNLPLYERIIKTYEGNRLEVKDSIIYINGQAVKSYRFKMDYYFVVGDNRANSLDSRYWGFLPEDHIIGKASFIWFSKSKAGKIRWERIFKKVS